MSQKPIPEFAETELWVVRSTLKERYGHDIRKTKINVDDASAKVQPSRPWPAPLASIPSAKTAGASPDKPDLSPIFWGD